MTTPTLDAACKPSKDSVPALPSTPAVPPSARGAYPVRIVDIPGKGPEPSRRVTPSSKENPTFILSDSPTKQKERFFRRTLDRLSPKDRSAVLSLSTSSVKHDQSPLRALVDTNALGIGHDRSAIFVVGFKVQPFLPTYLAPFCRRWVGRAMVRRPSELSEGEEMTIDYTGRYYFPGVVRRAALRSSYGFLCQGPACSLSLDVGAKSDERRVSLALLDKRTPVFAPAVIVERVKQSLALLEEEIIVADCCSLCCGAYQACIFCRRR